MYHPGSFTKNLGFGDSGLGRLQQAIAAGFANKPENTSRKEWRAACTLFDNDRQLVALNFFLCSVGKSVVVDELVALSLRSPHSAVWDRVALFSLNLGEPGVGLRVGIREETSWANQFIREIVANTDGTWDTNKINRVSFDRFLADNMEATAKSRIKVRNNYLYILRLCGITTRSLFNSVVTPEAWVPSALFLAWDRYSFQGLPLDLSLVAAASRDELHKVAGVESRAFWEIAEQAFHAYLSVGGLRRFGDH